MAKWQKYLWALVLLLALGGGFWVAISFRGCSNDELRDAPAGCFEFWFNRYQTLFGAIAAFAAAWIAVRPVWKQLNLASIQTNVALREAISSRANLVASRADRTNARLQSFLTSMRGYHD